jgi:hypothetical protein
MAADIRVDWDTVNCLPEALPAMPENTITWSDETILPNSNAYIRYSAVNADDSWDPNTHQDGLFKVTQITPANIVDFQGVIRAWKELVEIESTAQVEKIDIMQGDIMPMGIVVNNPSDTLNFGFEEDKEYTIKASPKGQLAPGNYGALALGGSGAKTYLSNILNGYNSLSVGQVVPSETGNIKGPTETGINERLESIQYVRLPVVTEFTNGKTDVEVTAFLSFKLVGTDGSGGVTAQYLGPATTDGSGGGSSSTSDDSTSSASYQLTLKCEVSWPETMVYEHRQKEIYSLKMFKGGAVNYASSPTVGTE